MFIGTWPWSVANVVMSLALTRSMTGMAPLWSLAVAQLG
jgi:hypothetical protein